MGKSYYRESRLYSRLKNVTDHETLRAALLEVEAKIKKIVGYDPLGFYLNYVKERDIDRIDDLLSDRRFILEKMFTYSEAEIKRMEEVNDLLYGLRKEMLRRTCDLYRTVLRHNKDAAFDDDYEAYGTMTVEIIYDVETDDDDNVIVDDFQTVLHLDNDDYYGSDFRYMLMVKYMNDQKVKFRLKSIEESNVGHRPENHPDMTDEELGCDFKFLDDGDSWAECLHRPDLDHICFCHAFHSLYDHLHYALADILRINRYWVEAKIKCQRITDQAGRRMEQIDEDIVEHLRNENNGKN